MIKAILLYEEVNEFWGACKNLENIHVNEFKKI